MSIYLIERKALPDNIYVCKPDDDTDWKHIHQFTFENGLEYYIGSNYLIDSFDTIIENIKLDYQIVKDSSNASELQQIYNNEYQKFINYSDCLKIWKYYTKNNKQITSILGF